MCQKCHVRKDADHFPTTKRTYLTWECVTCKRARDNANYAKKLANGRAGAARPKKERRTEDGINYWCPGCAQYLPRPAFHGPRWKGGHDIPSNCNECRAKKAKARPPKPQNVVQRPAGAGGFSRNSPVREIPIGDPEEMRFSARPCDARVGRELADHLHQEGGAIPFVRGWFTTVGETDEPVVQPRFESARVASMWNEMMYLRTGRRYETTTLGAD